MFTATKFVIGTIAPTFKYSDKVREGFVVEKVEEPKGYVLLKREEDGKTIYKTFTLSKMQPVE